MEFSLWSWWELEAPFPSLLLPPPPPLWPHFLPSPLAPAFAFTTAAVDGPAEIYNRGGHTLVLISLSRLGGISNSPARKRHHAGPTAPSVWPSRAPPLPPRPSRRPSRPIPLFSSLFFFFSPMCLRWCRNFQVLQHRDTFIWEILRESIMMTTFQLWNLIRRGATEGPQLCASASVSLPLFFLFNNGTWNIKLAGSNNTMPALITFWKIEPWGREFF